MRSKLTAIAFAVLGLASLGLAAPAFADKSGSAAYMSAKQLQKFCKAQGGSYGTAKPMYFCVIGSNAINCDPRSHQCSVAATDQTASSDDEIQQPDYPPPSLVPGLLVPDSPPHSPPPVGPPIKVGHVPFPTVRAFRSK